MKLLPQCGKCLQVTDNQLNVKMSWCPSGFTSGWSEIIPPPLPDPAFGNAKRFLSCFQMLLLCISLQNRADKKRLNIIIVAEGAIDSHNKAITPDYIKDVSTVEKPGHGSINSFRSMDFFPHMVWCLFPSVWEVFCPMCHCSVDFSQLFFIILYQNTHSLTFLDSIYPSGIDKCLIPFPPRVSPLHLYLFYFCMFTSACSLFGWITWQDMFCMISPHFFFFLNLHGLF